MIWIVVATIAISIGLILYYQHLLVKNKKQSKKNLITVAFKYKRKMLEESIYRCLCQMDKTNGFYNEEDEANRELTSCLNLLGHDAKYHYRLDNKRTADIMVDNCIIEGKLDPELSEADRLIGQLASYLTLNYHVYIVLYGHVHHDLAERLQKQVIAPNSHRVKLVYLNNAQRLRKRSDSVSTHQYGT